MDIHKPKPWHGVREFLKEYAIIFVGVVTALAAESAVEWLHWRHVVSDSQAELAADAKYTLADIAEREAQSPCLVRTFAFIQATLDHAAADGGRMPPIASLNAPSRRAWTLRSYDPIVTGQVLSHMDLKERSVVSALGMWSTTLQNHREDELRAWNTLHTLEGPGRTLGPGEEANLRAALQTAIHDAGLMRVDARSFGTRLVALGLLSRAEIGRAWGEGLTWGAAHAACGPPGDDDVDSAAVLKLLAKPSRGPPPPRGFGEPE